MFDHTTTTNPTPEGCTVLFTLYGDEQEYTERSENIAWHITDPAEGRVKQYRVVSGGEGWNGWSVPRHVTAEFLLGDGRTTRVLEIGQPYVAWRPLEAAEAEAPNVLVTTASALLDRARKHMQARADTYDKPEGERSMGATVAAFNAITGRDLSESEGWLLMQILKDVRDRQRKDAHRDSLEDGIAYAALKAEARLAGR